MKLVKCDVPRKYSVRGPYMHCIKQSLVNEVEKMNTHCLRVEEDFQNYNKVRAFASSFNQAAKRLGKTHIRARVINKEVYIINSLVDES